MPKITALPPAAAITTDDLLAIVDAPGTVPVTQKATFAQLVTLLNTIYAPITGGAYVLKAGDTMTGPLLFSPDNTIGIGQMGSNRPSAIYVAGAIEASTFNSVGRYYAFSGHGNIVSQVSGVFTLRDNPETSFGRLQFGGTTSAFPSLKRSTTTLQARLADDSAFADVSVLSVLSNLAATFHTSSVALTDSAAAALGTLTNAPTAGNPTKWIGINDNGTIRQIPAW